MGAEKSTNGSISLDVSELLGLSQLAKVSTETRVLDLGRLLSKVGEDRPALSPLLPATGRDDTRR
jgi:hypothetical protein